MILYNLPDTMIFTIFTLNKDLLDKNHVFETLSCIVIQGGNTFMNCKTITKSDKSSFGMFIFTIRL